MAIRNDHAIDDALESVAQALHGQQNQAGDKFRGLGKFQRNNPPTFKGRYDPEGAQVWLKEIEKIFRVMACTEEQKVLFGCNYWRNTLLKMCVARRRLNSLRLSKENMTVVEYAVKFEELVKLCPHYNGVTMDASKSIKFENRLRHEIKQDINYQDIHRFPTLVNKCRILFHSL
ncbi:uncharacterized protein LOC127104557 [Lathyrus oleraceus]|uniref:uncharacterized protein LOC127104557 n=1 Tax=Pisum sativum TaxID=3888 RepID=UPI0021CEEA87|nr:uncharacterized protein LOC127104557 [Pisum sativum]